MEILINVAVRETRAALLENSVLQELYVERPSRRGLVSNLYKGRVSRVLPGMQAAFVDIGLERTAFLHVADIAHARPDDTVVDLPAVDDIRRLVNPGDEILVQVIKDPIGTKGARLTTFITLPSRYLVYMPRGEGIGVALPERGLVLPLGKGRVMREGSSIAILSFGARLQEALKAADDLAARGLPTTVADARFCKPLDTDLVRQLARHHEVLITIEEGSIGGFGSHVLHFLSQDGLLDQGLKVRSMVLPDIFIDHDSPAKQYDIAGLNAPQIVATALSALGRASELPARA